jgi:hypothetical protein
MGSDTNFITIPSESRLFKLLEKFLDAYKERTKAMSVPPIGETSIEQKLDAVIEMLRSAGSVPSELGLIKEEVSIIHGLVEKLANPPSQPKPLEVTFVFKVANDHQDEPYSISIGGVTDAEGEALPDTKGLTVEVTSSDEAVVAANFDPSSNSGVARFGRSGVASLNASVKNSKGDILGSGAADFTVTTGDPAAVSDVKIAFGGLTEEAPAEV